MILRLFLFSATILTVVILGMHTISGLDPVLFRDLSSLMGAPISQTQSARRQQIQEKSCTRTLTSIIKALLQANRGRRQTLVDPTRIDEQAKLLSEYIINTIKRGEELSVDGFNLRASRIYPKFLLSRNKKKGDFRIL